jgi:hypothetical protein
MAIQFDNTNTGTVTLKPASSGTVAFTLPSADGAGGQLLQTDGSGVLSFGYGQYQFNSTASTAYTLVADDEGKMIKTTSATAVTITVPTNASVAYATGIKIDMVQYGAGQITVAGDTGVTVNSTPTLKTRAQYSAASLVKVDTDEWLLIGDLADS